MSDPVVVDMFCGAGGEGQGIKQPAPKFGRGGPLKIYLGVGGSSKVQAFVREHDLGWLMTPTNSRDPKEIQYCLDNGAFVDWKNGTEWNERKFLSLIKRYPDYDFAVAPDIVCGGGQSLIRSLEYVGKIPGPLYLAVQDGMDAATVTEYIDRFDGLFVGGSIPWKFNTARMWADLAHLHRKKCHAGRVGTWEGFIHMHFCGVDSVDTTTPARHQDDSQIRKYLEHLKYQSLLPFEVSA
jgi:hypothetical protein